MAVCLSLLSNLAEGTPCFKECSDYLSSEDTELILLFDDTYLSSLGSFSDLSSDSSLLSDLSTSAGSTASLCYVLLISDSLYIISD